MKENKLAFLRQFKIFKDLGKNKLLKYYSKMKSINLVRGQKLYVEGAECQGIYLIRRGDLKYRKKIEITLPAQSFTNNRWFQMQVVSSGIDKIYRNLDIATFQTGAIIGYEEIFRDYILKQRELKDSAGNP